ncbi:MAG: S-layer homology domain-containing protein [Clostridiales bacterium]|nr:S-layer homology domain-containing protein [Clostridiales bacterium]
MTRLMRKTPVVALALALALAALPSPATAAGKPALDAAVNDAARFVLSTVKNPQVDSVGGEWAVLGLARCGYTVPESYYEGYRRTVEKYVKDNGGVLHDVKYTEYSRVVLGLTAAGYDPRDVAGYDLTAPLADYDKTIWQGINGPIFALIALDSLDYAIPSNPGAKTQATRDMYVAEILRRELNGGGWNLTGGASAGTKNQKGDPDITGMALQALAKYQGKPEVKAATDKALDFLSASQDSAGGYTSAFSSGSSAVESAVQVLVALCELGIPADDGRFVKNGKTLVDNILSYRNGDGSFKHSADSTGNNQMATEQALYGLVAAQRALEGKGSLYRMTDTIKQNAPRPTPTGSGLPGKHADVKKGEIVSPGKTFADTQNHRNQKAVEALAARGLIGGRSDNAFAPDETMTRAEFAAIVARVLGLPGKTASPFADVSSGAWYASSVATAFYYELVSGVSTTAFAPDNTISRQEAAAMVARAARLCGMDTAMDEATIRDTLAQFGDYRTAADWAQSSLAYCYYTGLLDDDALDIEPAKAITRGEIAEMLYRLLGEANLI